GLVAADFEIYDEGARREVTRFDVIDLAPSSPEAAGDAPAAPAATPIRPRYLLVLFDLTFSNPIAIGRARTAAKEVVLASLHPSDLVAVATYSVELGPRLLVTFTPDRAQVARAIDSLAFDRSREYRAIDPLRFLVPYSPQLAAESIVGDSSSGDEVRQEIEQIGGETAAIQAEMAERESRRYETTRVSNWTRGLGELARFLAAMDGRKQVILFSEGFDSRLLVGRSDPNSAEAQGETFNSSVGEIWRVDNDLRYGNTELLSDSNRLVQELRRADCVVHAVDIGGLRASGEGRSYGRSRGEDGLFYLANESGGQMLAEGNDLASQLREVLSRTESRYLLTFRAENVRTDGAWRRLRVEVAGRRGLRVAHRSGWYAPRPFPELHPFERDLLAAETIARGLPRDEIAVAVLAAPFRAGAEAAYVPVILEIDGAGLVGGGDQRRRLNVYAYATTRKGEFRSFFHREVTIDPKSGGAALRRGGLKYYGHLELPPDDYLLRVLVRDGETGRVGAAVVPLLVPDFAIEPPALLPPFFFDPPGRWNLMRERTASDADGSVVYPFVIAGEPFVPQAGPRFQAGERPRFCLVGYNLDDETLDVEAVWLRADGESPATLRVERSATGITGYSQWLAELDLVGLAPGVHQLELRLVDRESRREVMATATAVRIEI
ncbi:MAG: VWA domain-containing protein, partial [Thermoanaerobaculia bacterium]|nr:VWA domain-containing protein [Thermoanaerobaculia bacterium]